MGLVLVPVGRHPIQRAAKKAAPSIDHPDIVHREQVDRRGGPILLPGELVNKLRLWETIW